MPESREVAVFQVTPSVDVAMSPAKLTAINLSSTKVIPCQVLEPTVAVFQVTPSVDMAILPLLPTATNLPLPYVILHMPESREVAVFQVTPSVDVAMSPAKLTAINLPLPYVIPLKALEPTLTTFQSVSVVVIPVTNQLSHNCWNSLAVLSAPSQYNVPSGT